MGGQLLQHVRQAGVDLLEPTSLSNSVVMSTEALVIIPNTPVHYRSERFEP